MEVLFFLLRLMFMSPVKIVFRPVFSASSKRCSRSLKNRWIFRVPGGLYMVIINCWCFLFLDLFGWITAKLYSKVVNLGHLWYWWLFLILKLFLMKIQDLTRCSFATMKTRSLSSWSDKKVRNWTNVTPNQTFKPRLSKLLVK